jgi:sigma-B regulation protein RsbU (phosphoserine phosphatase)
VAYQILITDDSVVNRELMKAIIKKFLPDTIFFAAENGNQALQCVYGNDIDLVILDLIMPEKDGFETLRELKEQSAYKEIPVIVSSALDKMENVKSALELGATDYFIKPLTDDQIHVIVPLKVKNALRYYEQTKLLKRLNQQMKDELFVAQILQRNLMVDYKSLQHAEVFGSYIPCNEIGGDFYDSIQIDDTLWFMIADVTGHGVASAMASSMLKVVFGESVRQYHTPAEILTYLNQVFNSLTQEESIIIFSAFIGALHSNGKEMKLCFANAGHPHPLILRTMQQKVEIIEENGFLIGAFDNVNFKDSQVPFCPGDAILAYTDGLFDKETGEACNNWYAERDVFTRNLPLMEGDPSSYIQTIIQHFRSENANTFNDDVAVMLIKTKIDSF